MPNVLHLDQKEKDSLIDYYRSNNIAQINRLVNSMTGC